MNISDSVVVLNFGTVIADGAARRRPSGPEGCRSLPRSRQCPFLKSATSGVSYGMIKAVQSISVRCGRRRDRGPDRPERSRQIQHAARGRRPSPLRRFDPASRDNSIANSPHHIVRSGMILVPEGRGTIGTLTRRGKPRDGGLHPIERNWRPDLDDIYERFPVLKRTASGLRRA